METIMILGGSILQLPAIKKAIKKGLKVIVVDMDPDAIGFKESGVIKEVISTIDIPKVLDAARRHKIDGIMTLASDMPIRTIAVVSKELGLVGVSEDTALKTTNKGYMRNALLEDNVPIPDFYNVSIKEKYLEAVSSIQKNNFKCIVKPSDNSGSRGVTLITNYESDDIEKAYEHAKQYSRSGGIIVEEYMEGPEVSVETLTIDSVCHVIQITDKLTTGAPYFVEMGHSQPSQLPKEIISKIKDVAKRANHAVGIKNGPSHTEIKVTKNGPKIVELGARLGGDCITTHLVPLSTGVDMVECCINIALGKEIDYDPKIKKASAIRYVNSKSGKIKSIEGIEEAYIEGIKQISIVHGVGDYAKEIQSSTDRVAFVIAQMDSVSEAICQCEKAINQINYVVGD